MDTDSALRALLALPGITLTVAATLLLFELHRPRLLLVEQRIGHATNPESGGISQLLRAHGYYSLFEAAGGVPLGGRARCAGRRRGARREQQQRKRGRERERERQQRS